MHRGEPHLNPPGPRRVLVVEDDALIAMLMEDMLVELGFEVVGPANRLHGALALAQAEDFELAILDVNLGKEQSFPVADVLRQRGIPFIFATGYGTDGLSAAYRQAITLPKPFEAGQLEKAISQALVPQL
jgi:DNA-binding response OmpR family regulator